MTDSVFEVEEWVSGCQVVRAGDTVLTLGTMRTAKVIAFHHLEQEALVEWSDGERARFRLRWLRRVEEEA